MSEALAQEAVAPVEHAQAAQPEQVDKTVPQAKVNELMGVAMAKGHQKGYDKAMADMQAQTPQPVAQPASVGMGGIHQLDQGEIDRRVADAYSRHESQRQAENLKIQQEEHGKRVINSLLGKVSEAQQRIPDYEAVTSRVDFTKVPAILHFADGVDNSGDVLYHLAQEPAKIGTLMQLSSIDPRLAQVEMKKLSDSLKQNQEAEGRPTPKAPLNSIKPSNTGIGKKPQTAAEWRDYHRANNRR